MRRYFEDMLKNKDKSISDQLHKYLQALSSIRKDLQDANVDQVISESEKIVNEKITI